MSNCFRNKSINTRKALLDGLEVVAVLVHWDTLVIDFVSFTLEEAPVLGQASGLADVAVVEAGALEVVGRRTQEGLLGLGLI